MPKQATVSRETFLDAIFQDIPADETPCIGRLRPNGKGMLQLRPKDAARVNGAVYFCISTVPDAQPKELRRSKAEHCATYVAVLDDIGTKVKEPPVAPSYKIETSPGNFQWGYRIERCEDAQQFVSFMRSLAEAGYTDPGTTDQMRMMRVPGSVNQKDGREKFVARITDWHPERVWNLATLATQFGVGEPQPGDGSTPDGHGKRAGLDPLLDWLHERGEVLHDSGEGYAQIVCPWHAEHGKDPREDAKFAPRNEKGERHFHCFHSSCRERHTEAFLTWAEEQGAPVGDNLIATLGERLSALLPTPQASAQGDSLSFRKAFPTMKRAALPDCEQGDKGPLKVQPSTYENVAAVVRFLGISLRFDMMRKQAVLTPPAAVAQHPYYTGLATDVLRRHALENVIDDTLTTLGIKPSAQTDRHLSRLALANTFHPFEDWMRTLQWDGKSRIDALAKSVVLESAEDAPLRAVYLKRWLVQVVEAACGWRNMDASRQVGNVFTLSGAQGIRKTSWFGSVLPRGYYHAGGSLHLNSFSSRDSVFEALSSGLVVELGELETVFSRSDDGALKNFLTRSRDLLRLPYGRTWEEWPRATAFCATVNDEQFLRDATGSRRYWPLAVTKLDTQHGVDIEQLWAEVYALWQRGEQWWLTDAEEAMRVKNAGRFRDVALPLQALDECLKFAVKLRTLRPDQAVVPVKAHQFARAFELGAPSSGIARMAFGLMKERLGKLQDMRLPDGEKLREVWLLTGTPIELKSQSELPIGDVLTAMERAGERWGK